MTTPREIAELRLARGEIEEEEFDAIVERLDASIAKSSVTAASLDGPPDVDGAPAARPRVPGVAEAPADAWNDPLGTVFQLKVAVGAYLLINAIAVIALLSTDSVQDAYEFLSAGAEFTFSNQFGYLLILTTVGHLGVILFACIALYRLAKNLEYLQIPNLAYSPGWTVGWFFVPIAWFWKPAAAVSHLSRASRYGENWPAHKGPRGLAWWFVTFWVSELMAILVGYVEPSAQDVEGARGAYVLLAVVEVVSLALFVRILSQVALFQNNHRSHLASSA